MAKKPILLCGFFVCVNCAVADEQVTVTPDGRMETTCQLARTSPKGELCRVTIAQLVITPERYHGKRVAVEGVFISQLEATGLVDGSHRIWLDFGDKEKHVALKNKRVLIEGVYNGLAFGHLSQWGGTIENITRIKER